MKKIGKTAIASAIGILLMFAGLAYATLYKNDRDIIQLKGNTIALKDIDILSISGASNIEFVSPSEDLTGIQIIAKKRDLKNLLISRKGNEIDITMKSKFQRKARPYKYVIALNSLGKLETLGSTTINSMGDYVINQENFTLSNSGSIKLNMKVNLNKLDMSLAGSSSVNLDGKIAKQNVKSSGSLYYKALDAEGQTASFKLSGGNKIFINAANELEINSSGNSNIAYKGNPEIKRECSGSCKVYKFKEKMESKDESK